MFDIGFLELILVGIVGLIVLGPERLPVAARTLGTWIARARRIVSQFTQEIDKEIEIQELRAELKKQGQSLDINSDVKKIQETVSQALSEIEDDTDYGLAPHSGDFEPLPRKDANISPPQKDTKPAVVQDNKPTATIQPTNSDQLKQP